MRLFLRSRAAAAQLRAHGCGDGRSTSILNGHGLSIIVRVRLSMKLTVSSFDPTAIVLPSGLQHILMFSPFVGRLATPFFAETGGARSVTSCASRRPRTRQCSSAAWTMQVDTDGARGETWTHLGHPRFALFYPSKQTPASPSLSGPMLIGRPAINAREPLASGFWSDVPPGRGEAACTRQDTAGPAPTLCAP